MRDGLALSGAITAVVFDLDGTLVDTMVSVPRAYADTIRALGGPKVGPGEVVAIWHRGPTPVVLAHFLGREISPDDIDVFYRRFDEAAAAAQPFPGVVEMIGALGHEGYKLGVFTTATRRAANLMIAAAALAGCFAAVVGGDEVSEPKPAPAGLHLACERMGATAAGAAYVGDSAVDIECAKAAGAIGIHASWGARCGTASEAPLVAERPEDVLTLLRQRRAAG